MGAVVCRRSHSRLPKFIVTHLGTSLSFYLFGRSRGLVVPYGPLLLSFDFFQIFDHLKHGFRSVFLKQIMNGRHQCRSLILLGRLGGHFRG